MSDPDWGLYWRSVRIGTEAPYILQEITGLLDSPDVRSGDLTLLQRDGQVPGRDYLGGRTIHATALVFNEDRAAFAADVARLVGALTSGGREEPLRVEIPGVGNGWVWCSARVRKRALKLDQDYYGGLGTVDVEWYATDPRLYSVAESTVDTAAPLPPGAGMAFDLGFDLAFSQGATPVRSFASAAPPGTVVNRAIIANTTGSTSTAPVIEVYGPASGIVVSAPGQNARLEIRDSYQLPAGTFLRIDTRQRSVAWATSPDDPGQSLFHLLSPGSLFFDLQPGPNTVVLAAVCPPGVDTPDVRMTVRWHDAWV
ncbi:phage tail domain-containing protein [Kutzneria chonburiensis]|uniref:Phage tail domain-containing protein n=1 Tax=Kutzneria chonburiensis TaxID=1483604 RepID=A0ABV6N366_9PSEU|nr:phage tail domain-containing protein [Kutzneria chonburiensis]